ncbi:MAG: multifunctional CCA addition/repair protein [Gammaproteobacteria bacterium]
MKTYMVGGAVRDKLLGLPIKDKDWVVVGASPKQMLDLGYKQVGADFPVFIHPQSSEEYALARTERKTAPGYSGFEVYAAPDVTLQDDLMRRDLTINAMAETDDGTLIDPFGGFQDLQRKLLRHVSPAFAEDPLRILRVARFAARFSANQFTIADETMQLMAKMVESGEANALVPERIWQETRQALSEVTPSVFFTVLQQCGALKVLFPEIDNLFGVPQNENDHPEIDTGIHTLMAVDHAAKLSADPQIRFAVLVHDLGKAATNKEDWPQHIGHEMKGTDMINSVCHRLRIPNKYRQLAILVCQYHTHCHRAFELKASTMLKTLEHLDAFRRPQRFEQFLIACQADAQGRKGKEQDEYLQKHLFSGSLFEAQQTDVQKIIATGKTGNELASEIRRQRVAAIAHYLANHR